MHDLEDLEADCSNENVPMVMKASFDLGQLHNEVQSLMQIEEFAKGKSKYERTVRQVPRKFNHGLLYVNKA